MLFVFGWIFMRFMGIVVLGVFWFTLCEIAGKWRTGGWRKALSMSWGEAEPLEALLHVLALLFMLFTGLVLLFCPT